MAEHTPTPWRVKPDTTFIEQFENRRWGLIVADCRMTDEGAANAAFIVKAVNNHEALVKELEAQREWLAGKETSAFLNGLPADDENKDRIDRITRVLGAVGGSGK